MKNKKDLFSTIVYFFSIVFYVVIGVFAIIIAHQTIPDKTALLSTLIILSSIPHFLIFLTDRSRISYLIIGFVGVAFGILFLTTEIFSDDQICMIWGVIDICRGLTEIVSIAPHIKHNKIELIEIAISLGDIVIGVLLCIHMSEGLKLHLTYLGIAFLISAVKDAVQYIVAKKNEKGSNNH